MWWGGQMLGAIRHGAPLAAHFLLAACIFWARYPAGEGGIQTLVTSLPPQTYIFVVIKSRTVLGSPGLCPCSPAPPVITPPPASTPLWSGFLLLLVCRHLCEHLSLQTPLLDACFSA